ncbi:MAG: STAS domain-containing protein [Firmicutes bacterium]|nr:STAS domain-containing protein [Bacillota bacterium]
MEINMDMNLIKHGTEGELHLIGYIDATNSQEVENILVSLVPQFETLVLDMGKLEYVSSAGLRAFRHVYMDMRQKHGVLIARNVSKAVMEVFEITGFTRLFKFE